MIALGFPVMGELCRFPGDYFTFNNGQQFLLGTSQIVSALQVKPRIRVAAKVTRQPQSCVRRNRTPLIYYRVQTGGWNMQASARALTLMPNGSKKSSRKISPGWIGRILFSIMGMSSC